MARASIVPYELRYGVAGIGAGWPVAWSVGIPFAVATSYNSRVLAGGSRATKAGRRYGIRRARGTFGPGLPDFGNIDGA